MSDQLKKDCERKARESDDTFTVRKFSVHHYMMSRASDEGKLDEKGRRRYVLICPNCCSALKGNPLKTEKVEGGFKHHVTFSLIPYNGKEYKILCCKDKKACQKQWMKKNGCDKNGRKI